MKNHTKQPIAFNIIFKIKINQLICIHTLFADVASVLTYNFAAPFVFTENKYSDDFAIVKKLLNQTVTSTVLLSL